MGADVRLTIIENESGHGLRDQLAGKQMLRDQ
jgi:hypothetical protein